SLVLPMYGRLARRGPSPAACCGSRRGSGDGRDHFDLHQEIGAGQTRKLDEGRGPEVALVEGAADRNALLAPGVDAQDPGGRLPRAGRRGAGSAQDVADVLVDLLRLAAPVARAHHGAIGIVGHLTGQVEQAAAVDDDALEKVATVVVGVELLQQWLALRRAA